MSPSEFEESGNYIQVNGVLTQQEKMRRAIKIEKTKFENSLENVINNRQIIKSEGI